MKSKFIKTAIVGLSLLAMSTNAVANFITADSVSSLNTASNNADALIENAIDTSYIAPSPAGGGSGTSTWHSGLYNTWTFDFDSAYTLDTAYIWDYYGHSPTDWLLTFFGSANGVGPALFSHNFSTPNPAPSAHDSDLYTINFASVADVMSVTLQNVNTSVRGGVGLAEVHFGGTAVPEPSTLAILGLGLLGLASRRFKKQA
jgi:hypothetical protein